MYTVGDSLTMTCALNGATKIELLRNGTVVLNGTQSQLVLQLLNSDSIHHNLYTCRGYTNSSAFSEDHITTIVLGT